MHNIFERDIIYFKKLIKNVDYVSFDIFDTLLIRPYQEPCDLYTHLEIQCNLPGFKKERIRAENRARYKNYPSEDVIFDKIYDEIQEKYKSAKEKELELEMQVLRPHPIVKQLYEYALKENKKIIVTSDMYLPKSFLESVLKKNGYHNIEKIYVSGEIGKCKSSGNLYKYIIDDMKISSNKILHVGDNLISDYVRAKDNELNAMFIPNYIQKFDKTIWGKRFKIIQKKQNSFDFSIIRALSAQKVVFSENDNYWYNFSYILGGILALAYVQFIYNKVKFFDIKQLLFISRDGYLLEKVYKMYNQQAVTQYIYAPRILNLKCFYDFRNNREYFKKLIDILKESGIILKYSEDNSSDLWNIINSNKSILENFAYSHREEYQKYLKNLNIATNNIAIVDGVTESFSTQAFLRKFMNNSLKIGFYLHNFVENNEFIYNSFFQSMKYRRSEIIVCIWELLLTSPEPPIIDLKDNKPIYSKLNNYIEKRLEIFKQVEVAVIDFAKDYLNYFNTENIILSSSIVEELYKVYELTLTKQDKENLNSVTHSCDICNSIYVPIYQNISLFQIIINFIIKFKNRGINFCKKRFKALKQKIKIFLYKYKK